MVYTTRNIQYYVYYNFASAILISDSLCLFIYLYKCFFFVVVACICFAIHVEDGTLIRCSVGFSFGIDSNTNPQHCILIQTLTALAGNKSESSLNHPTLPKFNMEPKNDGFQVNQFKLWDGSIHSQKMSNNATAMQKSERTKWLRRFNGNKKPSESSATACQPGKGWNVGFFEKPQDISEVVVSTHLKNICQNGSFPQVGVKIKNIWNHHLVSFTKNGWVNQESNKTDYN